MIMVAVIAMAGGVEAVTRFVLDGLIQPRHALRSPLRR